MCGENTKGGSLLKTLTVGKRGDTVYGNSNPVRRKMDDADKNASTNKSSQLCKHGKDDDYYQRMSHENAKRSIGDMESF